MDSTKLVIVIAVAFTSIATVLNWSELEPVQLIYKKEPDYNLVLFLLF
jgi:hypothetical protein